MTPSDHPPLPELDASVAGSGFHTPDGELSLDPVLDVPITLTAILGRTKMAIADVLRLDAGSVIELDRDVGEPVDIFINDRLVARGEVVLVDDRLGITMSEIVSQEL